MPCNRSICPLREDKTTDVAGYRGARRAVKCSGLRA